MLACVVNKSLSAANPASADLAGIEIAYQPIVSMSSLRVHGFEALARMGDSAPFADVVSLLDASFSQGTLRQTERALLTRSITKFARLGSASEARLFCNIDNRVFDDDQIRPEVIVDLVKACGLQPANICIELSERQPPNSSEALARMVDVFLTYNMRIAIDDFGQGFSGLDTLMRVNPHYVKIDQAFIAGIAGSPKQQAIVSKIVALSHSLGQLVVGEGIENESDFRVLRSLGCDLAQGYYIARPSTDLAELRSSYDQLVASDVRLQEVPPRIAEMMLELEPLDICDPLAKAVERFKQAAALDFVPVVDVHGYVHGAVYESDLRYFLFGEFGSALLANAGLKHKLERYVRRCPISEVTASSEALVDSYVVAEANDGVVLTLDGRYVGILRNNAILRLAAEREVASARDQNPLTFLPGNNSIQRHLHEVIPSSQERTVVFFDFDHFKAFNDAYGFALGDRAILMFAELLMKFRHKHDAFVGHVGGDDFFASIQRGEAESKDLVLSLAGKFRQDVESLYLFEDRAQGGLWSKDRFGETRFVPLLRASAALLTLPANRSHISPADIVSSLASGKSEAKRSSDGISVICLPSSAVAQQIESLAEQLEETPPIGSQRPRYRRSM